MRGPHIQGNTSSVGEKKHLFLIINNPYNLCIYLNLQTLNAYNITLQVLPIINYMYNIPQTPFPPKHQNLEKFNSIINFPSQFSPPIPNVSVFLSTTSNLHPTSQYSYLPFCTQTITLCTCTCTYLSRHLSHHKPSQQQPRHKRRRHQHHKHPIPTLH